MKKLLFFAILVLLFTSCEEMFLGDLYLVMPQPVYEYNGIWVTEKGVWREGVIYTLSKGGSIVKQDTIRKSTLILLPSGEYKLEMVSVFTNYWNQHKYEDELNITIRNKQTTRIDIPFF